MANRFSLESERNFVVIISSIFLILTFFVIRDIFALIVYSLILSYFIFPLYKFYLEKINNKRLSALLTLISVTVFLFLPLMLLTYFLGLSLLNLILEYRSYITNPEIFNNLIYEFLRNFTSVSNLNEVNFFELFNSLFIFIIEFSENFIIAIPKIIIYLFIVLFISYYALIYNKTMLRGLNEYLPLSLRKQTEILKNVSRNIHVLFKGYFLTGVIQTVVAIIGYVVCGYVMGGISISNVVIISFLTLITSLIPYLGTPLVWVPLGFYLIISGNQFAGIILLVYGTFVISMIDNFLRPVLMSDKDTLPAPIVFIGFIGGMIAFGLQGLILGPLVLSITAILLRYLKEAYELRE